MCIPSIAAFCQRECIDPNVGDKPEFGKIDAQTKELVQWRMNHVNASMHSSIGPKSAKRFSDKSDAKTKE